MGVDEREVHRIEVLSCVVERSMTVAHAAAVLCLSERQVQRLLKIFRKDGAASIRHKARGRSSHNRIRDGLRAYAMALVRESYADFGPTLAAEKLAEQDGVHVSRETLRIGSVRALEHHDLWSYAQTDGEVSFTGPVARRGQLVDVGSAS